MSEVLRGDGDGELFCRLRDVGKPVPDRNGREELDCSVDDEVLAPGVENRGAVSSRDTPVVTEEEESRLRSNSVLELPSIVDTEPLGRRRICGVHAVARSTHGPGAGSDDMGGGEASDCAVDDTVDASSLRTLFIVKNIRARGCLRSREPG